ncbi:PP2C family protein-serine/threonine phosphatase [Paractinoplanes maris]|uniref:PP2C family protein-serine/threonine phosphatase n=1 Tax=Paractinoplanes maris TaxID=1734446 RepID=UPI00201FBFF2|nr:GAF domain-containing SpoIIE family protein phosphatase [Actinoplanes maris]
MSPARLGSLSRTGLDSLADPALDRFAEMVRTVLRVPVALVTLVDADRQFFPGACGLGEPWLGSRETPLSHSFCQHVVATAEPLIVTDARLDPRVSDNLAIDDLGVVGYAGMPLTDAQGEVLGSLCAIDHQPRDWTAAELSLLAALAVSCSDSLRLRIANHRTESAAATMQKALLTALPQHEHLRMAARYLPAHHEDHVGGDWYDAISLDGGRLAVVIGDVAGHSIDAAARMSEYRGMLRTLLIDRHEPPSALLRRLEHTGRALGLDGIATVLVAYLDPDPTGGHTLTWSNAGHPPPTLIDGDEVTLLTGRDPLLGAGRRISRRNHTRHLTPGSTLVLHTDGLIETRSATIDEGVDRLHKTLAANAGAEPGELAEALVAGATLGDDDVAILIIATPGE